MIVKITTISDGKIPQYMTEGAVGADCYARLIEKVIVKPKTVETIPLGFAVEIPKGYEMQIRGRSGNARKNWVQVFNSPGTIDSDYRGEVGAILYNASDKDFEVNPGDRIAQAIVAPVIKAEWYLTKELSETERGEGGFGHTGVSENKEIEMAYSHKAPKFYEPFRTVKEVEEFIGKDVIIDKYMKGKVHRVYWSDFLRIVFECENGEMLNLYSTSAFERVKIDGHRFGKEIKDDADI